MYYLLFFLILFFIFYRKCQTKHTKHVVAHEPNPTAHTATVWLRACCWAKPLNASCRGLKRHEGSREKKKSLWEGRSEDEEVSPPAEEELPAIICRAVRYTITFWLSAALYLPRRFQNDKRRSDIFCGESISSSLRLTKSVSCDTQNTKGMWRNESEM